MTDESSAIGYVYLVEMEGQGLFKIGKTIDVSRRMRQFGIQPPFPYRLLFAHRVDDMHRGETCLHNLYRDYRLNGEWFRLNHAQVAQIDRHLLTWQAQSLLDRLASVIHEVVHDVSPDYLRRISNLLITAKRRADRRFEAYYALRGVASHARHVAPASSQSELLH